MYCIDQQIHSKMHLVQLVTTGIVYQKLSDTTDLYALEKRLLQHPAQKKIHSISLSNINTKNWESKLNRIAQNRLRCK